MLDPISNQLFSYNYQKFVLQDPNVRVVHPFETQKKFELKPKKSEKSKKDLAKQKEQQKNQKKKE